MNEGTHISWSEFASVASHPASKSRTLGELITKVGPGAQVYPKKSTMPLLKLAVFGSEANAAGALRHNANVLAVTGVEGDHDAGSMSFEEAVAALEKFKLAAMVFTTPSHTPAKPRWRVLAPTSEPLPPEDHYKLVARLNGLLSGCLAPESFTLSQAFYFGRVEGVEFRHHAVVDGQFIDLMDGLDEIAIGKREWQRIDRDTGEVRTTTKVDAATFAAEVAQRGRLLRTGDGRRDMLKSLICSLSAHGAPPSAIEDAVRQVEAEHFDPTDPIDWINIDQLIQDVSTKDQQQRDELCKLGERIWEQLKASLTAKAVARAQELLVPVDESLPLEPLPTLVRDLLPLDAVGMLWAEPGSYKSFLALDIALCVASGLPWLGRNVMPGRVWYIAGEGQAGLRLRIAAWRTARAYTGDLDFLHTQRAVTLDDEGGSPGLDRLLAEAESGTPPSLIVVDTLARAMTGDESSTRDASRFVAALDSLVAAVRKAGRPCCVMLVHHSRKDGEVYRGSSVLRGAADFEYEMRKTGKLACTLRPHKVKDGNLPPEVHLSGRIVSLGKRQDNHGMQVEMTSLYFDQAVGTPAEPITQEAVRILPAIKTVLSAFPGGASKRVLADALRRNGCAINDRKFADALEALEAAGTVRINRGGAGQSWTVTDAGTSS